MTDWNADDEAIEPSSGDTYGYWPGVEGSNLLIPNEWDEDESWPPLEYPDEDFEAEFSASDTTSEQKDYEINATLRREIDSKWASGEYLAARELILRYLSDNWLGGATRRYYRLLFATYFDDEEIKEQNLSNLWKAFQFRFRLAQFKIYVSDSDEKELQDLVELLKANFDVDALDAAVQSASILRKEFRRPDLALVILGKYLRNSSPNSPHFNVILLATYLDLHKLEEAEIIARRLMKYANIVDGAMKFALPVYSRFLLTEFARTGDFEYADKAKVVIEEMPVFGVGEDYYLRCLMRYQSAVGEGLAARETSQRIGHLNESNERNISPSAARFLEKSLKVGASLQPLRIDSVKDHQAKLTVADTLIEALEAHGLTGARIEESERQSHQGWFFHGSINFKCKSGQHNRLAIFRSHYATERLGKMHSAHYIAVYCYGCNVVNFTTLEEKKYFENCRRLCERIIPVKDLCISCNFKSAAS